MKNDDVLRQDPSRLHDLKEQADHARRRYELYKAKAYGPRPTSPQRLAELKRDADRAAVRAKRVKPSV